MAGPTAAVPWLHAITNDEVVGREDFVTVASRVLEALGPDGALHLRARTLAAGRYVALARRLLDVSRSTGSLLVVNGRLDVALAAGAGAVQLGRGALEPSDARRIAPAFRLGASVHPGDPLPVEGVDWLLFGHVYPSRSHPAAPAAGPDQLTACVARAHGAPVIAIGGVTPERVAAVRAAGARGVAVLSGIWGAREPWEAVSRYLSADADGRGRGDDLGNREWDRASRSERHDTR